MEDYIKYGPRFSKNEGKCTNNAYEGEAQALDCSKQSVSDMIFFTRLFMMSVRADILNI